MKLPGVENAPKYQGLYVYDFGDWTAVGYTAGEIAILVESERYRGGKVYRIHRATPDGRMELQGVSANHLCVESGMFFYRRDLEAARADFESLKNAGDTNPPPCRAFVHLTDRSPAAGTTRYVTALIYAAEHESEMARWLTALAYEGGDVAEGGPSHVSNYQQETKTILDRQQLWSPQTIPSRSADQVMASVRQAVQR